MTDTERAYEHLQRRVRSPWRSIIWKLRRAPRVISVLVMLAVLGA